MKTSKIAHGHKYFESQQDDETVIFVVRKHWTNLIVPFILGTIIIILTLTINYLIRTNDVVKISDFGGAIMLCVLTLVFLFTILYVFLSWLVRYFNVIVLTNEHLVEIEQAALFSRKISQLSLDNVEDATAYQHGFFRTMFHFGNILIQTAGEMKNFEFHSVPFPYELSQKIMETKEEYMKTTSEPRA